MADGAEKIRFLLDSAVHTVDAVSPTTTVLQYLREHLGRCGTKEGCAEGDCGACTVVLGELVGESHDASGGAAAKQLRFRAVNACIQFLPTLDGKALFTVESLRNRTDGSLHPVQRAMVECHGSQCGFCTPGFVMSLYALYRTEREPDEERARQALSGNLCRCTGYRPILAAAQRMYEYPRVDGSGATPVDDSAAARAEFSDAALIKSLQAIRVTRQKRLSWQGANYVAPSTIAEVARACAEQPKATILAGGTDVGLWVTKKYMELPALIYVGNVAELKTVTRSDAHIDVGAAVSLTDAFAALESECPELHEIARRFASPPICNAGTLGGNVANGSPIGDSMPALIALGASVILHAGATTRTLPLEEFYLDYMKKDLRAGEFVVAVRVPRVRKGRLLRSYKIAKRYDQDISSVCAAFCVELKGGKVRDARVAFGGMAATPRRATACEQALIGANWDGASLAKAAQALAADFQPLSDMRASANYRAQVATNLLRRFQAEVSQPDRPLSVWTHVS
jgi:xanthine dehydrogenase small subunit